MGLLAFTLLMLGVHGSKADKVTSCLQCQSVTGMEDSECIDGTAKGTACATDAVGCYVQVVAGTAMGVDVANWARGCCTVDAQCTEMHEEAEVGGVSGMVDQIGCTTNDCNDGPKDSWEQRQHLGARPHRPSRDRRCH